jgi:hypothetical protein
MVINLMLFQKHFQSKIKMETQFFSLSAKNSMREIQVSSNSRTSSKNALILSNVLLMISKRKLPKLR